MSSSPPIADLFSAIVDWAVTHGAVEICKLPGCWESEWTFDDMPAFISINRTARIRNLATGSTFAV